MIPILVHKASASSIEWVVRITVDFFLSVEILDMIVHMNLLAFGSMPVDGSSKKTIGGLPTIAIATETFHLFPPDKFWTYTFQNSSKSISLINLSMIFALS